MLNKSVIEKLAQKLQNAGVSNSSIDILRSLLSEPELFESGDNREEKNHIPLRERAKPILENEEYDRKVGGKISIIPGSDGITCNDLLAVICRGENKFYEFTTRAIAHSIQCSWKTKAVVIVTDFWKHAEYLKYRKPIFKALHDQFGNQFFVIKPDGSSWAVEELGF